MQKKTGNIRRGKSVVFGQKEKKRLLQLGLCICLFLGIFLGRSNEVAVQRENGERLLQIIRQDTDFIGAFSALGESIAQGDSVLSGLETFAKDLFGMHSEDENKDFAITYDGAAIQDALVHMLELPTKETMLAFLGVEVDKHTPENEQFPPEMGSNREQTSDQEMAITEPEMPISSEIPVYSGPALPENATMGYYDLGLNKTVTPVLGEISSEYGYRVHPLTGENQFHAGVDIAADQGTPIAAFSDGTVEFIGESDAYGLYIQLDHGNGIKSFYCHCEDLLLGKGKPVKAGQTIALVGDTGETTGFHLHLELKREGTLLNPEYYIESIN